MYHRPLSNVLGLKITRGAAAGSALYGAGGTHTLPFTGALHVLGLVVAGFTLLAAGLTMLRLAPARRR